ncbi:MAG TPA: hydrogenase nickel incorporation protein HypB [Verrucomicrobiae bacterium]|nr:hydrogenase nickel incorporation protein HypB [Verrucomicrobiae bacterium]
MCLECGCNRPEGFSLHAFDREGNLADHEHAQGHDHGHTHDHPHPDAEAPHRSIPIAQAVLTENDRIAERNRGFFLGRGIRAINLMSSPGAGKTTLVAATLDRLATTTPAAVIVGDLQTLNDAERLRGRGAPVVQINTGSLCHLDASMIARAIGGGAADGARLLLIENVGNLVCPAAFDLGENERVALFSVTEGEDKPLKYPSLFQTVRLVLLTKIDLAAATGFDRPAAEENIRRVAPDAQIFALSARTGEGIDRWLDYLRHP